MRIVPMLILVIGNKLNMATKHEIFKLLDEICEAGSDINGNTSSLSIREVAAVTNRPEKVIGMHFFNPVPAMKLVEVIKGRLTSAEVHDQVFALSQEIGKVPASSIRGSSWIYSQPDSDPSGERRHRYIS